MNPQSKLLGQSFLATIMSQVGIIGLLIVHHISDPATASAAFAWLLCVALASALPNMLKANPYTFGWNGFTQILVFIHGITQLFSYAHPSKLISLILFLSLIGFAGGIHFARNRGRQLGLSIRKKKTSS